jgi:hypothetical protein
MANRSSMQKKRAVSPLPSTPVTSHKKIKVQLSNNETKNINGKSSAHVEELHRTVLLSNKKMSNVSSTSKLSDKNMSNVSSKDSTSNRKTSATIESNDEHRFDRSNERTIDR